MEMLLKLIVWIRGFFKKDPLREVEREAEKEVNAIDDGQPMSDFLNEQLRDDE